MVPTDLTGTGPLPLPKGPADLIYHLNEMRRISDEGPNLRAYYARLGPKNTVSQEKNHC